MLNLYLKLSLTSFKNNFSKNNWHYINHLPVLNQEILINPELSHACIFESERKRTAVIEANGGRTTNVFK